MELRRGMFRVWVIASIIWIVVWGLRVFVALACRLGTDHFTCSDTLNSLLTQGSLPDWVVALGAVAPPLLLLVVGGALLWIVDRFWESPTRGFD
jgi:hypothetical protein